MTDRIDYNVLIRQQNTHTCSPENKKGIGKSKCSRLKYELSHFFEFSFSMMLSELVEIEDKGQLRINRVERSLKAVLKARKRWQLH